MNKEKTAAMILLDLCAFACYRIEHRKHSQNHTILPRQEFLLGN